MGNFHVHKHEPVLIDVEIIDEDENIKLGDKGKDIIQIKRTVITEPRWVSKVKNTEIPQWLATDICDIFNVCRPTFENPLRLPVHKTRMIHFSPLRFIYKTACKNCKENIFPCVENNLDMSEKESIFVKEKMEEETLDMSENEIISVEEKIEEI
jgi:hypothetical protein